MYEKIQLHVLAMSKPLSGCTANYEKIKHV